MNIYKLKISPNYEHHVKRWIGFSESISFSAIFIAENTDLGLYRIINHNGNRGESSMHLTQNYKPYYEKVDRSL